MDSSVYDADYFLHGLETGKSLYQDYRFLPNLTRPMAAAMAQHLGIRHGDTILDVGCSRGYLVRAFREMGYDAWGMDVSEWAISNADEVAAPYLHLSGGSEIHGNFSWIVAKDSLEHVERLDFLINEMLHRASLGIFVVVPLSPSCDKPYVCDAYERDVTHIWRLDLAAWARKFMRPGWVVEARYRLPWIKQNWYKPGWERGNGFLTVTRESNENGRRPG